MLEDIVFLGWDRPWTDLFAEWLKKEPDKLRHRMVVVPTRESGRRLRERLVAGAAGNGSEGAILGPRVTTPDDFFRPDEVMPDTIRWAAWLKVLRSTEDRDVAALFPSGLRDNDDAWRLAVVRQIEQARDSLVSGNADFTQVCKDLSEDKERWSELAKLEKRVVSQWQEWGFADPVAAKRMRAQNPVYPQGVDEIILAGISDPTGLALEAWKQLRKQKIRITILVGAPATLCDAFDDWGRPRRDFWSDRNKMTTPEPTDAFLAADPVAAAEAVVRACEGRSNKEVVVGVCDPTFAPAVARRFHDAGWPTFEPEKRPLAKDAEPELIEALAEALETPGDLGAFLRVTRHPAVWDDWLTGYGSKATLAALDKWELENATSDIEQSLARLHESRFDAEKAAGQILQRVYDFIQKLRAGDEGALKKRLFEWLHAGNSEAASHARTEMESWQRLEAGSFGLALRLTWLAKSIASVSLNTDSTQAVLALQGWLELPFDPSPHLILVGLHEGSVPEAPPADPLITDVLRESFGLRDRRSRLAREVFLYTAMIEGRRANGSVTVINAQVDAKGEPCRPSRILLQTQAADLPARVIHFIKETPDIPLQPSPPWARANWKLSPPSDAPANKAWDHVSPSTLKSYLACPTRFYFSRVLGWEKFETFDGELSAGAFGDLIHAVLRQWGDDPQSRNIEDASKLRCCWLELLKKEAQSRFGSTISPLIRLQIIAAEERLAAFSQKQAEEYQRGWRVVDVEKILDDQLVFDGIPVHMRVDRIDRNAEDGRVRVIDYKTGKTSLDPRNAHLRVWSEAKHPRPLGPLCVVKPSGRKESYCCWTDLQLPLYAAAVQAVGKLAAPPEACYVLMPEAVGETRFAVFENLSDKVENALEWAKEATRRIRDGVFWPPAPEVKYDDLLAIAPEGLLPALGEEWQMLLNGNATFKGDTAP